MNTVLAAKYNVEFNNSRFEALSNLNGKILYDSSSGIYYRVEAKPRAWSSNFPVVDSDTGGADLRNFINNHIIKTGFPKDGQLSGELANGDIDRVRLAESS